MSNVGDAAAIPIRLLPDRRLPPYSYVTGKYPHPLRDADGHSYGVELPRVSIAEAKHWRTCEPYLWGVDLFNRGYYWEAHETWEAVWHATGQRGTMADFVKLLIKFAAAGVKAREGRVNGVQRHALRARQLLESVATTMAPRECFMGLSLSVLIECAQKLVANPAAILNASNEPVVIVMPFHLQIEDDPLDSPMPGKGTPPVEPRPASGIELTPGQHFEKAVNVPVFNCIVYVSPIAEGGVRARVANLAGIDATAGSEREALGKIVRAFKQVVGDLTNRETTIPWIDPPDPIETGEQTRYIPVHL